MMLFTWALAAALTCPLTTMRNLTSFPWNAFDRQTLKQAQKRCPELYPKLICVKIFTKTGEKDYFAICGAPR